MSCNRNGCPPFPPPSSSGIHTQIGQAFLKISSFIYVGNSSPGLNLKLTLQEQALRAHERWQALQQEAAAAAAAHSVAQLRAQSAVHEAQERLAAEVARHAEAQDRLARQAEELSGLSNIVQQLQDAKDAVKVGFALREEAPGLSIAPRLVQDARDAV